MPSISLSPILTKVISPFVSADRGKAFQVKYFLVSFLAIFNPHFLLRNYPLTVLWPESQASWKPQGGWGEEYKKVRGGQWEGERE